MKGPVMHTKNHEWIASDPNYRPHGVGFYVTGVATLMFLFATIALVALTQASAGVVEWLLPAFVGAWVVLFIGAVMSAIDAYRDERGHE